MKNLNQYKVLKFSYLKQLDILRALSVLGVILYHYTDSIFLGGWLGVDVFFVLSGYLISNTIISSIENNSFSIKEFYKRRAKRILPSLLSTILFTLPLSFQFLAPKELIEYLRTVSSSLLFFSNFYLSKLDFYNTPSAKLMPLIHTWSLSIEEQFYIIFPIIILFCYKKNIKSKFNFIFYTFLIFLTYAFLINSNVAFYLPQFRFWEFLLGVVLMYFAQNFKIKNFSNIGLLIILLSFIYFEDLAINTMTPRVVCLLGASIYLLGLNTEYASENVIKKCFIFIGKISYSLYLFHQPLYSFYKIYLYKKNIIDSKFTILFLVLLLFLISSSNYFFIENRFQKKEIRVKNFLFVYSITAFLFLGFAVNNEKLNAVNPLHNRLVIYGLKSQNIIQQNNFSCENRDVASTCYFDTAQTNKKVYSLGDSSLRTISYLIEKERENLKFDYVHFGGNGCLPILNNKITDKSCPNKDITEMTKFINNIENSIVIYGGRLPLYLSQTGFDNGFEKEDEKLNTLVDIELEVTKTINQLLKNDNIIILIYPIPTQGWNVPNLFFYEKFEWGETVAYQSKIWKERSKKSNKIYDSFKSSKIVRVYPEKVFCEDLLDNYCVGAIDGKILYSDDDHLSIEGAYFISNLVLNEIKNLLLENY